MKTRTDRARTTLVIGETCRVDQCGSGNIHLTLGDLTLRMPPAAFVATAAALGLAAGRLDVGQTDGGAATRLLC